MFDCGPAATQKLVKVGIFPTRVDYLFFTYHHFDHDVDYPCFLLCRWDQSVRKENQLRVYGPTLTETITERIIGENGAFVHHWKARVNHPASQRVHVNRGGTLPRKPPFVFAKDVGSGIVHQGAEWRVVCQRRMSNRGWTPWRTDWTALMAASSLRATHSHARRC